jgi:hypothetical protein
MDGWAEPGSTVGTLINPTEVFKDYKRLLPKAGLVGWRYHDLR